MKLLEVKAKAEVIITHHPHAQSLNKKLITESSTFKQLNDWYTNIRGEKWPTDPKNKDAPSNLVFNWVTSLLYSAYHVPGNSFPIDYDIEMWFAKYNKGDFCRNHHHMPYALFSFVYFVNCPRGSSPLIFKESGKRIKAEEGKIVIFSSTLKHYVPKNRCDNRLVLAGNMRPVGHKDG